MTRTPVFILLTLIAFFLLAVALNAPRVVEANAHTAAATAMQAQANVTGMAVFGMACLAGTLGLVIVAGIGLFVWLTTNSPRSDRGRVEPLPHSRPRSGPRRLRLASTTLSQPADIVPVAPEPSVTVYGYGYPDEIEIIPFNLPPGWDEGQWPDAFWTEEGR